MTTDGAETKIRNVDDLLSSIDNALADAADHATGTAEKQDPEAPPTATPELVKAAPPTETTAPPAPTAPAQGRDNKVAEDRWWDRVYRDQNADLDTNSGAPRRPTGTMPPSPAAPAPTATQPPSDPPADADEDDAESEDRDEEDVDGEDQDEGNSRGKDGRRKLSLLKNRPAAPAHPPGIVATALREAEVHKAGWYPERIRWVLRWGTPAVGGWGLGAVKWLGEQAHGFTPAEASGWLWLLAIPAIPSALLAWKARGFWPPLAWMLRIPLSTLVITALINSPATYRTGTQGTTHMDGTRIILASNLGGGFNLGTVTAAGLAGVVTAFCVFYLKSGGENKYVRWVRTEFLIVLGFAASSFYESAGWTGPSSAIRNLTSGWAHSWGYGALALIITLFLFLRKHSDKRAVILGFVASTLYAAAGGSWAWPENLLTALAHQLGLV